jgi:hypothetical protein
MTVLDFFLGQGLTNTLLIVVNFLVFAAAIHFGARIIGVKRHFTSALVAALALLLVSFLRSFIFLDAFFFVIIVAIVEIVAISRVFKIGFTQAFFIMLVSAVVFIVLNLVIVPIMVGSAGGFVGF